MSTRPRPVPWRTRARSASWGKTRRISTIGSAAKSTSRRSGHGVTSGIRPVSSTACATRPSRRTSRPSEEKSTRKSGSAASRHAVSGRRQRAVACRRGQCPRQLELSREHGLEVGHRRHTRDRREVETPQAFTRASIAPVPAVQRPTPSIVPAPARALNRSTTTPRSVARADASTRTGRRASAAGTSGV